MLTAAEERELFRSYRKSGSRAIEDRLVRSQLRLAAAMANGYSHNPDDVADLTQEGALGVLTAVRRFDVDRGVRLSTYAGFWIRAFQLRWLVANARLVRIGKTAAQRKIFFSGRGVRARLASAGVEAGPGAVAHGLGVSEREADETLRRLDARELPLLEANRLADEHDAPESLVAAAESRARVADEARRFGSHLSGRDRALFEARWLAADEPPTLDEMGRRFGVSRERARQLEARLLDRFREFSPSLAEAA